MDRCPDCLVAGDCVAMRTGHRPYCDWMRAGGARRARVFELSAAPPVVQVGPVVANPIPVDYGIPATLPGKCCG